MGFGEKVKALLDTFDSCITLLNLVSRLETQYHSRRLTRSSDQQAMLKHSLKTDRNKVKRAYSSRLSESGGRFEKGDSQAKSALSRVLKKLNVAIASMLRVASKSQGQSPILDYQSLIRLSKSSRMQAIATFDRLSHRLGSKSSRYSDTATGSSSTTCPSSPSKLSKTSPSSGETKIKKAKRSRASSDTSNSKRRKDSKTSIGHHHHLGSHGQLKTKDSGRRDETWPLEANLSEPLVEPVTPSIQKGAGNVIRQQQPSTVTRFSLVSMVSSNSTKLGEIPERKWNRRCDPLADSQDQYNVPVVYPVRPYQAQAKERRFLGLFRKRS